MGAVLGLIPAASLACCCTGTACSLCCSLCPSSLKSNSTATRFMYALMLVLGAIVGAIMLAPGLQDFLQKVPFCANSTSSASNIIPGGETIDCSSAVGYLAVYRICFALVCFFALWAVMMIGVRSSKDGRAALQNGFWGIKFMIVIGIAIGAFFIPETGFGPTWMWVGMIGGFAFILVQLVYIIDFAHNWAEAWVSNYEEDESRGWFAALCCATGVQYVLSLTGVVLLFVYYTQSDDCALNKFFIIFNLILCIAVSILSISPSVQEVQPKSGLLQSSMVTLYTIYLTWSAVANNPDAECNPGFLGIIGEKSSKVHFDKTSIVGLIIWLLCILYSSMRSASNVSQFSDPEKQATLSDDGSSGARGSEVRDNEEEAVAYNWSLFHIVFITATLYVMMTLTNWYQPNSSLDTLNANAASMWVKMVSSWMCVALYGWTMVAPMVLTDLMMIGVRSSKDGRAALQNGFWGIKFMIVIGIAIGAFFIPETGFGPTWMWVGMIGGFAFILVQLVYIIDFAHNWAEAWVSNYEEDESRGWFAALCCATGVQYVLSLTGVVLLFVYYTQSDDCALNKFFIIFNLILCIAVSILSISPSVQEVQPKSGLLQSSMVTLYTIYLTWSAVANNPDAECNPGFLGIIGEKSSKVHFDKTSIVGLIIWLLCILYSSMRSASNVSQFSDPEKQATLSDDGSSGARGSEVRDNEEEAVAYNWSLFHIVFITATLYVMMTLTNWYQPNSSLDTLNANAASMWVKMVSSWMCVALYGWTMVAPMVLTDREFN